MKVGDVVKIYNECGEIETEEYEIESVKNYRKDLVKIKNVNGSRYVPKDRIIWDERSSAVVNVPAKSVESVKPVESVKTVKPAKTAKPVIEKFDVNLLRTDAILFKGESGKHNSTKTLDSYVMVSSDGKHMKHFNLYNGTLGKKSIIPTFDDNTLIKNDRITGNIQAITEYLNKKGYQKI